MRADTDPAMGVNEEHAGDVLPLQYYFDAAREVELHVKDPTYFVFSDYPVWTAKHFKVHGKTFVFPTVGGRTTRT